MNMKIFTSLLTLGTLSSSMLIGIPSVFAGNGSNIIPPVTPPPKSDGNGSNSTNNNLQFPTFAAFTANVLAAVNNLLTQILAANPSVLANATSNGALLPTGASPSLVAAVNNLRLALAALLSSLNTASVGESEILLASADPQVLVAQSSQKPTFTGNVTAAKLNAAIVAYNTYVEALVADIGGDGAVAFLSSSGGDKALDSTNSPGVRGLLLALSAQATSKL
jgi:hypothetical protein